VLVNTFGNIPYTEALNFTNPQPKYDDAKAIYDDLFRRLDAALASINPESESFGSADLIYGGDLAQWVKFGNSLKLKLGVTIADADPAMARTIIEQAAPNVFTSNADNAVFQYLAAPPNTNPVWVSLVQSGRKDFVAANTLVDRMNELNDPRRPEYFTLAADETYTGGIYGASNNYATFSKPSEEVAAPDFRSILLSYSEVEFYLAEAVEQGFNVGGTAAQHYENGITASMQEWGVSDAEITAYLLQPQVAYATATGDWRQKIGVQEWIAFYNRGYDAWTTWRRLDYPQLQVPANAVLPSIPVRFPYPVQEQNLNTASYNQATSDMGGDTHDKKLFWDKF
jgi:hypothetical protein